ncbi:hypothetical protein NP493_6835g00001 [Ridgeia piscesae]|uniref:Uncharacterized protein n=1 Tax=Ridgeia piscesae TaxID=27915 RepID=A0AAD9IQ91_RIDPI|nr:hypothetical protein NP493_6835g00001 [Ridgeia piscesae]
MKAIAMAEYSDILRQLGSFSLSRSLDVSMSSLFTSSLSSRACVTAVVTSCLASSPSIRDFFTSPSSFKIKSGDNGCFSASSQYGLSTRNHNTDLIQSMTTSAE